MILFPIAVGRWPQVAVLGGGGGAPPPTFPVVESRSKNVQGSNTATHAITLPSGVQVGDLLVVLFGCNGGVTVSISAGTNWAIFDQDQYTAGALATHAVLWKVADGTDALTVGTSSSNQSSHCCLRISNHGSTFTGAGAGNAVQNPNNVAHTPAGGLNDYLWVAMISGLGNRTVSAAPTNYLNLQTQAGSAAGATTATSERELSSTTDDPATWTTSGTTGWYTRLLAIPPA